MTSIIEIMLPAYAFLLLLIFSVYYFVYFAQKKRKTKLKGRLYVSMVKPGQSFILEHKDAFYGIYTGYCKSNDPITQKIYFTIHWANSSDESDDSNDEKSYLEQPYLLSYDNKSFENFHVLNVDNPNLSSNQN